MKNSAPTEPDSTWLVVRTAAWRQIGADLAYLLPGFFLSLVSFIVLITLLYVGVSTLILWVGLPVLVLCMASARSFASVNRAALARWSHREQPVYYKDVSLRSIKGMFASLGDAQKWRDLAHGTIAAFSYRTVAFCVALTWLAVILGGLTQWFWLRFLPKENHPLAELIGLDRLVGVSPQTAESWLGLVYGVVFLLLLPFVTRFLAATDAAMVRGLLTNEKAALRARSAELTASRAQVVSEEAQTLRKIERDLHDGPQQRLIRLQMDVEAAQRRISNDPAKAHELMDGALEQSREALNELRALSRGIAPPLLADRGLRVAVESIAARATVPVQVQVHGGLFPDNRLPEAAENAAFFVVSEALANVSKHSGASRAAVTLDFKPTELLIEVSDDGRGGAHAGKGHGLAGLIDRLAGVDGSFEITSPDGGPTSLRAVIPLGA